MIYHFLHYLSKMASYFLIFSVLFLLQKFTLGYIPVFKEIVLLNKFYLHEILFILSSLIITIRYFKVSSPYKTKLNNENKEYC